MAVPHVAPHGLMHIVNGIPAESLPANDRGLLYGDGVFRTLKKSAGITRCWARQYRKLAADCSALGLACPDETTLARDLSLLPADCVARITVTRGPGARGYAVPPHAATTRVVSASALPDYPPEHYRSGVRLRLCALRLAAQPALAGIKHLNRLENVLARMEWDDPAIVEGLLLDEDGHVIEGVMSNVFALRAGELWTPDLSRCGVAGVQRERIMEHAVALGVSVRVGVLSLDDLMGADEIMLSNSVIGLWRVREFAGRIWPEDRLATRLRRLLDDVDD